MSVIPQPEGYLIQGRLTGTVGTICHRCSEVAKVGLDHHFETFEAYEDTEALEGEENHLRATDTGWELNATALLWEEFLLAMPEKFFAPTHVWGYVRNAEKTGIWNNASAATWTPNPPWPERSKALKLKIIRPRCDRGDTMPLPKKKTSKSRRNMRRSHDHVAIPNVVYCECGEASLSHCICPGCGKYKGRQYAKAVDA